MIEQNSLRLEQNSLRYGFLLISDGISHSLIAQRYVNILLLYIKKMHSLLTLKILTYTMSPLYKLNIYIKHICVPFDSLIFNLRIKIRRIKLICMNTFV